MTHTFKLSRRTARLRVGAFVFLITLAGACESADRLSPADPEAPASPTSELENPDSTADSTVADSTATAESASFYTSATAPGIAFGDFGLPKDKYYSPYSGSLMHLTPGSWAMSELSAARSKGMRVVVSLAGGRSSFKNSDGTFSMSKWKYNVSKWKSYGLGTYISGGTIIGHYVIDEPNWAAGWGGKAITASQIEEMARYSKSIWPTMATGARVRPGALPLMTFRYLDFAWAQWEGPLHVPSYRMTPEQFRDRQIADAKARGLNLVFGVNFLDGGDGSSRIPGTYDLRYVKTRWQMSAYEVSRVGKVLAAASYACGLISWRWSPTYPYYSYLTSSQLSAIRNFHYRSDVKSSMSTVGSVARNRTRKSCL